MPAERAQVTLPPRPQSAGAHVLRIVWWLIIIALVAYITLALIQTEFNPWKLIAGGASAREILSQIIHPDWRIFPHLLKLMNETVEIALIGTLIAIIISFPLSFLAAKNLMLGTPQGRAVYFLTRLLFNVLRAFEPVLLAVLFVLMLGKLFSEAIEGIDSGPVEAIQACGGNRFQVIWYGILPQVAPAFLAFAIYRWDINIRMSIVLGIVGAGGIGFMLLQYMNLLQYSKVATAFIIILVVVTALDYASAWLRTRLGQR
jgi:ABC-type phosphate/phosphonate transport system permease subunit